MKQNGVACVEDVDQAALGAAIQEHGWRETTHWDRDPAVTLRRHVGELLGPTKERGRPCGIVVRAGRRLAAWGDVDRVDMTFSLAKSYLSIVAGLAHDDGRLALDSPVGPTVLPHLFIDPPSDRVTWRHLLTQASGWRGELFGRRDSDAALPGAPSGGEPGAHFAYNDVRVNLLAYALLALHGRSLEQVLRERVMAPLGAADGWSWHGYDTSWVDVGGARAQSVSGGGHWGGGLWTSAADDVLVGRLLAQGGVWEGRRLLSSRWIEESTSPSANEPRYGLLWWLNVGGRVYPSVPADSFMANGGAANVLWVWPRGRLVVVARWLEAGAIEPLIAGVVAAVGGD